MISIFFLAFFFLGWCWKSGKIVVLGEGFFCRYKKKMVVVVLVIVFFGVSIGLDDVQ